MDGGFDLIVIGGGAAGFYGAIQAAELHPEKKILILEKSNKLLAKVRISGGGRCNVTHRCFEAARLSQHYPRGQKSLRKVFQKYNATHTLQWFAARGVEIKTEEDGRMFPVSNSSKTIIDCFLAEAHRLGISIQMGAEVVSVQPLNGKFEIITRGETRFHGRKVLICTGGHPRADAYGFIAALGHTIKKPIPSLFTFNDSAKTFSDLMGVSVANAEIRIARTKFLETGPLLITHWGLSGPAVIKLSAWAAEHLHSVNYDFTTLISWIGAATEDATRSFLLTQKIERVRQKVHNHPLYNLPQRLWAKLCAMSEIPEDKVWSEVSNRHVNKLLEYLIRCSFHIRGKTTYKDEFVTCGGVDLSEIDLEKMESRLMKGVYFAGEALDIDGETGGFNFQAAWSTAAIAAQNISPDQRPHCQPSPN